MEGKEIIGLIKKGLIISIKTSCKYSREHPLVLGVLVFMLLLYRSCPSLFAFLISSSPVIICTAILLGALLTYGEPNVSEIEEEYKKTHDVSSLKTASVADDVVVKKDKSLTIESIVENKREIEEMAVRDTALVKEEKDDKKEIYVEEVNEEKEGYNQGFMENRVLEEKIIKDSKDIEGLNVEVERVPSDSLFDSSLGSPWQPIEHRDDVSSDSESDGAESSSPDASMADIIPMLDELHPLLDSESHPPVHDHESDDSSADEVENQEDEEGEEGQDDDKDYGAQDAVTWTADDQKNLMDLGTSELERNQRLENLIAKRSARNLRYESERNLVDLGTSDTAAVMENLSHLLVQIPHSLRRNPFDLPYDSDEAVGLPPIPGSAPSVLLPRRNPFDFPYDQVDKSFSQNFSHEGASSKHQEFVGASQSEVVFHGNESFSEEQSFYDEVKQEQSASKLRPYFVVERMDSDEAGFSKYQRQSSGMSDSKVSSVPESDSVCSNTDPEDQRELVEQELHYEGEQFYHDRHVAEPVELSDPLRDIDHSNEGSEPLANAFGAVEEEMEFSPPISEAAKLEEIEEIYDEASSSSSLEVNMHNSRMNISEEPGKNGVPQHFHLENTAEVTVDEIGLASPLCDSSPLATETSLSNVATVEALRYAGNEDMTSSSPVYEIQAKKSELDSASPPDRESFVSEDEDCVLSPGGTGEDLMSDRKHVKEVVGAQSDLAVIEAKSLDDIYLAMNQFSDASSDKFSLLVEPSDGSVGILEDIASCSEGGFDESVFPEAGPSEILHVESMRTHSDLHVVEAASLDDIHFAFKQLSESKTESLQNPIEPKDETAEAKPGENIESACKQDAEESLLTYGFSELGSSEILQESVHIEPIGTQSEEIQVVEAKSIEDIDLALKQLSESPRENSPKPIDSHDTVEGEASERPHPDPDVLEYLDLTKASSEMVVLEAKSIEDISLAFKHITKEVQDKSLYSGAGQSETLGSTMHVDPFGSQSDLYVVDATSLEDIHIAFRQISDETSEIISRSREIENRPAEAEPSNKFTEPEHPEVCSTGKMDTSCNEAAPVEVSSTAEKSSRNYNEVEKAGAISSSNLPNLTKKRKKDKKSSSSSSSSSSDSD